MKHTKRQSVTRLNELQRRISMLADREPESSPVISCYMDAGQTAHQLETFIRNRLSTYMSGIDADQSFPHEEILKVLMEGIGSDLPPRTEGLAVFADSKSPVSMLAVMPFAVPLHNSLTVSAIPDIFPLLHIKKAYGRFLIVLAQPQGLEIAEVNLGDPSLKAWVANRDPRTGHDLGQIRRITTKVSTGIRGQVELIDRLLLRGCSCPLFLAGDSGVMRDIANDLAPSSINRLMGAISVAADQKIQGIAEKCISILLDEESRSASALSTQMLHESRTVGQAVTGPDASLIALKSGVAKLLVIGTDFRPEPGWPCDQCRENQDGTLRTRGSGEVQAMNARMELIRLAGQRDIPVEFTDEDALHWASGVACLVHDSPDQLSLKIPQNSQTLHLVA